MTRSKHLFVAVLTATGIAVAPTSATAAWIDTEIGISSTPGDAQVLSPALALGFGVSENVSLFTSAALTSIAGGADDGFRPSNITAGLKYRTGDYDEQLNMSVAVAFGVDDQAAAQNFAAGAMRGFFEPWRWSSDTVAAVVTWEYVSEFADDGRIRMGLDFATLFPTGDSRASLTAAWQLYSAFEIPLSEFLGFNTLLAAVGPTERILGRGAGGVVWLVEPEVVIYLGPIALTATINIPFGGPLDSPFGETGKLNGRFGLRLGF